MGDFDNDGDIDAVVNCVNAVPQLLRCDSTLKRSWVKIRAGGHEVEQDGDWGADQGDGADRDAVVVC